MSEKLRPISYQGLGNMIEALSRGKYAALAGEKIASVETTEDGEHLVFTLVDGRTLTYVAVGDCCSWSWIEHLTFPPDIYGTEVTAYKEAEMGEYDDNGETIRVYQTAFRTDKGEIIVEFRNSSNGYYGGWLDGPVEKPSPDNRIRELTKAGALIAAALDSLLAESEAHR